ncbi:MAG: cell surface protein SprA, partial [Treponemataceae bacterium]|nr:cell surface protein SprA [Treponemataceae bacterium]
MLGEDPIFNTIWGLNLAWQDESQMLTRLLDKLPFYSTNVVSKVAFTGEFAHFIPGHSSAIGSTGTSYIDDFEAAKSTIDLRLPNNWYLASTPQGQTQPGMFPEAALGTGLAYGFNRAGMSWYIIDPLFYDRTGNVRPKNITKEELSRNQVRQVLENEVFPAKEIPNGVPTNIAVLNVDFYPNQRGPYNYDVEGVPGLSYGINPDGTLKNPRSRWGGIMRKIESTDFEATNVEYIEFWMMDPFADDPDNPGGDLYFNLGDISEDVLRDGRKSFENGLPTGPEVTDVDTTLWGRVPRKQSLVNAFDNDPLTRKYQDVGYDGLSDEDERSFFEQIFLQKIINFYGAGSQAYIDAYEDPSADNFRYFRGTGMDQDDRFRSITERYRKYQGPDGNSPTAEQSGEPFSTMATTLPNTEDINNDNTLSEEERYFQYKIELRPDKMNVGENHIADIYYARDIPLENGQRGAVKWYQFKIPINDPQLIVGDIQDFKSIRFMRMFFKNWSKPVTTRFA